VEQINSNVKVIFCCIVMRYLVLQKDVRTTRARNDICYVYVFV
jgi:hypothetical protein